MNRLIRAGLLAATTIAVLAGPSLAQTRDDPVRPKAERSKSKQEADTRLRIGTPGMTCIMDEDGIMWAAVVNETGATIPAGSVVTIYIQPGNIVRAMKLQSDWKPGTGYHVSLKNYDVTLPAFCAAKVQPGRKDDTLDNDKPQFEDKPEVVDAPKSFGPGRYLPGRPDFVTYDLGCEAMIYENSDDRYFMKVVGPEPDGLPPGTVVYYQILPDGEVKSLIFSNGLAPGKVTIVQTLSDGKVGPNSKAPDCAIWAL